MSDYEHVFSRWSPTNSSPTTVKRKSQELYTTDKRTTLPIMDYCSDDIFRHIFSFLGYKRILKIRLVSQEWKNLADDNYRVWMPLYESRFGFEPDDPLLNNQCSLPWKQLCQFGNWHAVLHNVVVLEYFVFTAAVLHPPRWPRQKAVSVWERYQTPKLPIVLYQKCP